MTLEGVAWRFRTGSPWRDLPAEFGAWQSVWERHRRWSADGASTAVLSAARAGGRFGGAERAGLLCVDSTSARAHQHAGGPVESQEPGPRAR